MIISIIGRFSCDSLINLHFHFMTDYINFPSYFLAYIFSVSDTHNQENKKKEKSFSDNLQYSSKANLQIQLRKWPLHLFVDFILFSFLCLGWPCITALPFCPFFLALVLLWLLVRRWALWRRIPHQPINLLFCLSFNNCSKDASLRSGYQANVTNLF